MPTLAEMRDDAMRTGLSLRDTARTPVEQFGAWLEQAKAAGLYQPRAATLATVNALGRPAARMVVLAGFGAIGFDFTTDARSPKAADLRRQPWAALVFFWPELERQVRLEGETQMLDRGEVRAYFERRARESRLAAWASRQSEVIDSREILEKQLIELLNAYDGREVDLPPDTAGYRLSPAMVEFWQGRSDHLHDRVRYRAAEDGAWITELLAP